MRRIGRKIALGGACCLIALALLWLSSGCGSGSTVSAIDLRSPGVQANGELKPTVRCGWGSLWVPLEWGSVPAGTKELAVLIGRFKYANEGGKRSLAVQFADLVSAFKPSERQLVANVLPEGVSWSYFGNNCVTPQPGQKLLLEVFALDRVRQRQITRPLATRLTEEALEDPQPTGSPGKPVQDATAVGRLITGYTTGPH
jgi:hypothetical protein